jgi:hypothetical protein
MNAWRTAASPNEPGIPGPNCDTRSFATPGDTGVEPTALNATTLRISGNPREIDAVSQAGWSIQDEDPNSVQTG